MKNKSKLKKIQQRKSGGEQMPKEWLYLCEKPVTVREIYDILIDNESCQPEVWEEAGVLEIAVPEDKSIDIEKADSADFDDELCRERLQGQQVQSAFYVTVGVEKKETAERIMQQIMTKCAGIFCTDNEQLTPFKG